MVRAFHLFHTYSSTSLYRFRLSLGTAALIYIILRRPFSGRNRSKHIFKTENLVTVVSLCVNKNEKKKTIKCIGLYTIKRIQILTMNASLLLFLSCVSSLLKNDLLKINKQCAVINTVFVYSKFYDDFATSMPANGIKYTCI